MQFLAPYALVGFLLALPIVAFYILRVRLRRREVATLMFWQEAFQQRRLTAWWRRLRHLLSLLVQLMLLSLLVLAAARPLLPWEDKQRRDWSLVLDNSASMSTRTRGDSTRLERAREQARKWLSRLPEDDRIAILVTAPRPHVVCSFTTHRPTLRKALRRIAPTAAPARLRRAIALARSLTSDPQRHRVVLFSDGCAVDGQRVQPAEDLWIEPIGSAEDNVAITRLAPRRSYLDPRQLQVLIEVHNYSRSPRRITVELDLNEHPIDVMPIELAANGHWRTVQEYLTDEGGVLTARIDDGGALPADDRAWAVVPALRKLEVHLVTQGNLFLEKVFEAMANVQLSVSATLPQHIDRQAVVVFHRRVPAQLPANPTIVIDPSNDCSLWRLGGEVHQPLVATSQSSHPLMAHVRLDQVLMPQARRLTFTQPATVLASTIEGEPLYALVERTGGDVLVLSANLDESDLPLRTAFPIMMANALAWLTHQSPDGNVATPTGRLAEFPWPDGVSGQLVAVSPTGRRMRVTRIASDRGAFGPVDEVGVWSVRLANEQQGARTKRLALIAAVLDEPRESNVLATWTDKRFDSPGPPTRFGGRSTWWYLALAALALGTIEWYLYQRRWLA